MMKTNPFRRRLLAGLGLAASLALASCATTPTPYQPASDSRGEGGYSERQIAPDRWRVTFAGNALTSRETVEGYLLYRAAELTLAQGNDWFEIMDRQVEHEVRRESLDPLYDPWWRYPYWRPSWRYYGRSGWAYWYPWRGDPFWASRVDARTVERFEASAEIAMHRGQVPPGNHRVFDAREVTARLAPQIRRP